MQVHIDPLDDNVRESLLARLPDRQAIERDLAIAWRDIATRSEVLQTRLHYLDERIEIDLVLPVKLAGSEALIEAIDGKLGSDVRVVRAPCMGRCECAPVFKAGLNDIDRTELFF